MLSVEFQSPRGGWFIMSGTLKKHNYQLSAYVAGGVFLSAAAILLWMLLQDWAKLIAR